jgi:hypothetical protein
VVVVGWGGLYTDVIGGCKTPQTAHQVSFFFLPSFLFFLLCLYFCFLKLKTFKRIFQEKIFGKI